jgi:hypothetical protein
VTAPLQRAQFIVNLLKPFCCLTAFELAQDEALGGQLCACNRRILLRRLKLAGSCCITDAGELRASVTSVRGLTFELALQA